MRPIGMKLLARCEGTGVGEAVTGNHLDQALVAQPVALFWDNNNVDAVASSLAGQYFFETRNDAAIAVQVRDRVTTIGGTEHRSLRVAQRVMNQDDLAIADIHVES